jgi:alpha-ribazole phosphatase
MTVWHWVRHGPTHAKAFVGWRDVPADLSDTAQIARLDAHLPKPALLVSSDLIRSVATADVLGHGRRRLPHDAQIREFNFGEWDGQRFDEITATHPKLSRHYWENPGDVAPPGGESWNNVAARVAEFVDAVNARHPATHIIAVAHSGVILTQIQRAAGCTAYAALAHEIDNLSVTRLIHDGGWRVGVINHTP